MLYTGLKRDIHCLMMYTSFSLISAGSGQSLLKSML